MGVPGQSANAHAALVSRPAAECARLRYFNDALTFALYSSAFAMIAFSSRVRIFASRTTGRR